VPYYETLYATSYFGEVYGRTLVALYYYSARYKDAEGLIQRLLKNSVDDYEMHYYLGLVFAATDRRDNARIELEKTIAVQKNFDDAWRELISLAVRRQDLDLALQTAQRFTVQTPQSPNAWRLLGYVHNLKKDFGNAVKALEKAVKYDSTEAGLWFELGSSYERNKDVPNASRAFRKVLAIRPGDASAANYLGYMWAEHGMNLDSAKILLEMALKKEPANGAYLDSYAWIFYQLGDLKNAYDTMIKAMSRLNSDPVIFSHYGDIMNKKGEYGEAIKAYEKSIELNADDSDTIRKKIVDLQAFQSREK
jgi:tetratricopeptide (TPR) repeat protein